MGSRLLDYVRRKLLQRTKPYTVIAAATGIGDSTLRAIADGVSKNPGVVTIETLADYFMAEDGKSKPRRQARSPVAVP